MKVIVSGGLGNQMFQYALFLALKEKQKNVTLDTSLYSFLKMHNGFELKKCFGIEQQDVKYSKWDLLKLRALLKFKPKSLVFNDPNYFDEKIFKTNCYYLSGYWQSEKYFKQIEEKIKNAFNFKNIDESNKEILTRLVNHISIAIHIRRGDYLGNSIYSGVCTDGYYSKAIQLMISKIGTTENIMFYVFSDDMEFSAKFIEKFNIPYRLININSKENSYKDMCLMSMCRHNIIANSSFSWWGAWLNGNPDKIVIAPQNWFNGPQDDYKDIVPESWIKL